MLLKKNYQNKSYLIFTTYSILVPVANPQTQQALLQVAVAIGGLNQSIVYPLSLVELEEDYLYQSTPEAAAQLIQQKKQILEDLIQTLEPPEFRKIVQPIIRISNDVPLETANTALANKVDLVLVGWHRPAFSDNRLGGRVGKILNTSPIDVAVFINKKQNELYQLLK
ncbi:universal stress protein, partial [Chroococcus sp. FPU101]|uniref:universal stress protein n=1 Tax=Chroococcus sp. FPU101 TaxID=1974212 RepID=UPI0027D93216